MKTSLEALRKFEAAQLPARLAQRCPPGQAERVTAGAPGLPQGAAQIGLPAARGLLRTS